MKSIKILLTTAVFICFTNFLSAQMNIDGQEIFGNEWIDFNQDYFKITLSEDGIYRIYGSELQQNGIDLNQFQADELQLIHWGKQIPIYVSTNGSFSSTDFIEFIGRKNTGELDKQLYNGWEQKQLNLEYSNITDQTAYFLSWESGSSNNLRIEAEQHAVNSSVPTEQYYIHDEKVVFDEVFTKPSYTENVRFSHFDVAEGFGSGYAREREFTIESPNLFQTNDFSPEFSLRLGTNATTHELSVRFSDREIFTENFSGYRVVDVNTSLTYSDLQNQNTVRVYGSFDVDDRYTVAHSILTYPRAFNFNSATYVEFQTRENSGVFTFDFEDFNIASERIVVIDETENKRYEFDKTNNRIHFSLAAGNNTRIVHLLNDATAYKNIESFEQSNFIDYTEENPSYLFLSSEKLVSSTSNGLDQYETYRSSEIGGSYSTYLVKVEDLYDQFSFGMDRNPLSVRNFMHYINQYWKDLEFALIVGKGLEYASYRKETQINDPLTPSFYVPTWGFPGSDNLLMAEKGFSAPKVAVGRIAARNDVDVVNYLNKVIDHDLIFSTNQTKEDKLWTKEIIHLSGGDPNIQQGLYNHLLEMEGIIENSTFGADVTTFRKSSADVLQSATSTEILSKINQGKALITFFGHSGVGTFDFSLEDVAEWKNEGKLPMIISLGCHSGNIHGVSNTLGLSESFILEPEKGAILFLASSSSAFISPQAVAGKSYYNLFGNSNYNKPVGRSIQDYLISKDSIHSLSVKSLNQQLTFHGDPAVKFYTHPTPDYIVDHTSISSVSEDVTITDPNIAIQFDVLNLGNVSGESFEIRLIHYLPDNTVHREYTKRIDNVRYKAQVEFVLDNPGLSGAGKNRIDIILDTESEVTELPTPEAEENNQLTNNVEEGYCFFIKTNIVRPKYPNDFSIINTDDITFIATGNNAFNANTHYIVQLDTSDLFESPLVSEQISQENGTVEWNPNFDYKAGTVYYWRIALDNEDPTKNWQKSSFVYLPNESEGWNQSHLYQYLYDDLSFARFDDRTLRFPLAYEETTLNLFVPDNTTVRPRYRRDNTALGSARLWTIPKTGICILLRNPLDLRFVTNDVPGLHGSWSSNQTSRIFFFETETESSRIALVNFLEDVIEDGQHVFLNTIHNNLDGNLFTEAWAQDSINNSGKNIYNVLESYGAKFVREMENNNPHYALFFTKGGAVHDEDISQILIEGINLSATLPKTDTEGTIQSTLIGPSESWYSMDTRIVDIESHDSIAINVYGLDHDFNETLIYANIPQGLYDLSEISGQMFPYLKLTYFASDEINRTYPQLEYWRVYHREIPELIYNTQELLSFNKSKLAVGETLQFEASIKNITSSDMDSVLVKYTIVDEFNTSLDQYTRNAELSANNSYTIDFDKSTTDMLSGNYQFIAELNPDEDQVEQEHRDNFFIIPFEVLADRLNPILDVRFDNKHIINGEIVSSSPLIEIKLTDPEATLALDNIADFQIALFRIVDGISEKIETVDVVSDSRIEFIPGSTTSNMATVLFRPNFEPGEYIFVTQAKDRAGNFSGSLEYSVRFNVDGVNQLGDITVFPNPISDSDFNILIPITGTEIPSEIEFSIFNSLGQRAYSINTREMGIELTAGTNVISIPQNIVQATFPSGVYYYIIEIPEGAGNLDENYLDNKNGSFVIIH